MNDSRREWLWPVCKGGVGGDDPSIIVMLLREKTVQKKCGGARGVVGRGKTAAGSHSGLVSRVFAEKGRTDGRTEAAAREAEPKNPFLHPSLSL